MTGLGYAEVGSTEFDELPAGYRHVRQRARLGEGEALLRRVGDAVMAFELQRRAGLHPTTTAARAAAGVEMSGWAGFGPLRLPVPCRVVWAVDRPDAIGFGYGTLPGHPALGEEAFLVTRDSGGAVWLEIRAFSRPQRWFIRLAGPVGHLGQRLFTARYVKAARAIAAGT